jgi:hypothetical protein
MRHETRPLNHARESKKKKTPCNSASAHPVLRRGGAELDAGAALLRRRFCGSGVATTLVCGREVDTHLGVDCK